MSLLVDKYCRASYIFSSQSHYSSIPPGLVVGTLIIIENLFSKITICLEQCHSLNLYAWNNSVSSPSSTE